MTVNGKLEVLLNLALNVAAEERRKSAELEVGYDRQNSTWELIVKYNGDINKLNNYGIQVEELLAGYAIVRIREELINAFTDLDEVEYVEKPKRLYFSILEGKRASCVPEISVRPPNLSGRGVLLAVIDSGLYYQGMEFRKNDGSSRILYLWDQSLDAAAVNARTPASSPWAGQAAPPEGFRTGVEFSKERIDAALRAPTAAAAQQLVPSRDTTGHGTGVTAIAAATGALAGGRYTGMAPESDLIIVKLGFPAPDSFPRTTELMRALTYVTQKAVALGMPLAINLSFGNNYGSHDGTSILERFVNNISGVGRSVICVGSGNEGAAGGHVGGRFGQVTVGGAELTRNIELNIADYQQSMSVQIWKEYSDRGTILLIAPNGARTLINTEIPGQITMVMEATKVLVFVGEPSPYSINQEIFFDFMPVNNYVNSGIWTFTITPSKTSSGNYDFYLPCSSVLSAGTRFFTPTPEKTLTIPSTSARVITVGAYDAVFDSYADFSGRGYVLQSIAGAQVSGVNTKPDLTAPGVNINTVLPDDVVSTVSGTSFAVPFVTGAAALLMEWGIVQGNDRYLYGEKVKAYLRSGARALRGEQVYPNARVGYGALCVAASLPQ